MLNCFLVTFLLHYVGDRPSLVHIVDAAAQHIVMF